MLAHALSCSGSILVSDGFEYSPVQFMRFQLAALTDSLINRDEELGAGFIHRPVKARAMGCARYGIMDIQVTAKERCPNGVVPLLGQRRLDVSELFLGSSLGS